MKKVRNTIGIVIDTLGSFIIYGLIAAAVLFMVGQAKHYYDVGYGVFSQQGKDARGTGRVVLFTVEEGVTAMRLGEQLEEQGIIESARLFVIQEKVSDYSGKYVPGQYVLSSEMTTEEIMRVISGTEVSPYSLPEPAKPSGGQELPDAEPHAQPTPETAPDGYGPEGETEGEPESGESESGEEGSEEGAEEGSGEESEGEEG